MAGYINKEDLLEAMKASMPLAWTEDQEDFYFQWGLDKELIEGMPSTEIVQCKDCIFSRKQTDIERRYLKLKEEMLVCTNERETVDGWIHVLPNHFCKECKPK